MSEWAVGNVILDDYLIEKELGRGGMGRVWLVKSNSTGRQFAVKQALIRDDKHQKAFLAELQTWIDLPEHPNIVPCRFFRTVGDEVLIFADYIAGGSLKEWIDTRRLYEGGPQKALERMLDIAIQFAWGLHCLHELGLVHQDVKPGNVLMADGGTAAVQGVRPKVTDYGLARARAASGERYGNGSGSSILVSSGGCTPAYCSPEQFQGLALTSKTDVWSWGMSVLEMFTGQVTWASGRAAPEVLAQYMEEGVQGGAIPFMPVEVAAVLKGCFREDPAERWENLDAVVQRLRVVYRSVVGAVYDHVLGEIERRTAPRAGAGERRTRGGITWTDPREWVERALRAEGRDPAEAVDIVARQAVSRRGHLVADLAAYDAAHRIYDRLVNSGRKDLENDLATLCLQACSVHETADDYQGALSLYDRAIEIRERQLNQEGRRELADDLAGLYTNKALAARALGDNRGAVALSDRAIEIRERQVNQEGRRELADNLAALYMNKAVAVNVLGDSRAAVVLYDRALEIYERLVNQEGQRALADRLARLYQNKANALCRLGDNRAAVALYDRALEIYERQVNQEGRRELADRLAGLYTNKAGAVSALGDSQAAVALHDRALEIRERQVNKEGRRELADRLAALYLNKANALYGLEDNRGAGALYDRALEIYERLVNQEGRRELAGELAWVKARRGVVLILLGETDRGKQEAGDAMAVLRVEVERTGRADLKSVLDWTARQLG